MGRLRSTIWLTLSVAPPPAKPDNCLSCQGCCRLNRGPPHLLRFSSMPRNPELNSAWAGIRFPKADIREACMAAKLVKTAKRHDHARCAARPTDIRDRIYLPPLEVASAAIPAAAMDQQGAAEIRQGGARPRPRRGRRLYRLRPRRVVNYLLYRQSVETSKSSARARQPADDLSPRAQIRRMARRGLRGIELPRRDQGLVPSRPVLEKPGPIATRAARQSSSRRRTAGTRTGAAGRLAPTTVS